MDRREVERRLRLLAHTLEVVRTTPPPSVPRDEMERRLAALKRALDAYRRDYG